MSAICANCREEVADCSCEHTTALHGNNNNDKEVDMLVVNKLTKPGDIRRVDLEPDTVLVHLYGGKEKVYRLSTELKVVCAWCGKDMGNKPSQGVTGTSHGMCQECYNKNMKGGR